MNSQKVTIVSELKDKASRAKSFVLTDYQGMTHKQLEELHKKLRAVSAEYVVAKNSLLKIATGLVSTGPTATLFSYGDEITPIQELFKFIKSASLPKVKGGTIDGNTYDAAQIEAISKLPSKQTLQGQVVGQLNSPIYSFAYTLNANLQKLVYVLGQIRK